jgi:hypothetical protein
MNIIASVVKKTKFGDKGLVIEYDDGYKIWFNDGYQLNHENAINDPILKAKYPEMINDMIIWSVHNS